MNNLTSALLLICLAALLTVTGLWALDKEMEIQDNRIAEHRKEMKP